MGSLLSKLDSVETGSPQAKVNEAPEEKQPSTCESLKSENVEKTSCAAEEAKPDDSDKEFTGVESKIPEQSPSKSFDEKIKHDEGTKSMNNDLLKSSESHSETTDKNEEEESVPKVTPVGKPRTVCEMLTEASRHPLPMSPCVDSRSTSVIKNRDNAHTDLVTAGKTISTAEEVPSSSEVKTEDDPEVSIASKSLTEQASTAETAAMTESAALTEATNMKEAAVNAAAITETAASIIAAARAEAAAMTEAAFTTLAAAAAEGAAVAEYDQKKEQQIAECVMTEDASVTKDVPAQDEVVAPVEELAEQLSNVVISTAANELNSEMKTETKCDVMPDVSIEPKIDHQQEEPIQDDTKQDGTDKGLHIDKDQYDSMNIDKHHEKLEEQDGKSEQKVDGVKTDGIEEHLEDLCSNNAFVSTN